MTELLKQLQATITEQIDSQGNSIKIVDTVQAIKLITQILEQLNNSK